MNHQPMRWVVTLVIIIVSVLTGCSLLPWAATPPANVLVYDAPVTLTIKKDDLLPGTTIAYGGKLPNGAAKVLIAGLVAPKQTADTLDWQGAPAPDVTVKLTTRVTSYDDQALNLAGAAHIEVKNVVVQPGGAPGVVQMEFTAPATFSLNKNQTIPGSNVSYLGTTADGAQFANLEGYPYRKTFDSLEYNGRLNSKVFLRLELRVLNFSDTSVMLGGKANVKIEQ